MKSQYRTASHDPAKTPARKTWIILDMRIKLHKNTWKQALQTKEHQNVSAAFQNISVQSASFLVSTHCLDNHLMMQSIIEYTAWVSV